MFKRDGFSVSVALLMLTISGRAVLGQENESPATSEAPAASSFAVTLLGAGDGEKTVLRFKVKKGLQQSLVLTVRTEMKMSLKDNPVAFPSQKLPSQRMTTDLVVRDVSDSGDITYGLRISKVEFVDTDGVSPQVLQFIREASKPLQGLAGSVVISNRGLFKKATYQSNKGEEVPAMAKQAIDSAKESLKEITIPLPEAAVGVGGRWTVSRPLDRDGMNLISTEIYELTKFVDGVATVKITSTQTARPQELKNPNGPPGAKMKLQRLNAKGDGTSVISLSKLGPDSGVMTLMSRAEIDNEFAGQKQSMVLEVKTVERVAPAPAAKKALDSGK